MTRLLLPASALCTVVYVATGVLVLVVAGLATYAADRWIR